ARLDQAAVLPAYSVVQAVEPVSGFAAFVDVGEYQNRVRLDGIDDPVRVSANDLAADHGAVAGGQAVRPWARGRVASARHAASTSLLSPASLTSSGWRSCSCCRRFAARSARSASWHESGESFSEEQAGPSVRRIQSAADSGAPHFETESAATCIPALHTRSEVSLCA